MKKEFADKYKHIYFIGIGGISMSGLAEILKSQGFTVSGSDIKASATTKHLESAGIVVNIGHDAKNITGDIQLVVYTAAVKAENPELSVAGDLMIPIMDRAHLLGLLMDDYRDSIAIAGTHGKTTTTSMVSQILLMAELDPTITLGGILPAIRSNIKIGNSPYFVAEACEYFDSFLQFHPKVGVILNVEADHLDYFKTLENIRESFRKFGQNVPKGGLLVADATILNVEAMTKDLHCQVEYFAIEGQGTKANWEARNICHEESGFSHFQLYHNGVCLGYIQLNVPGDHNVKNALAACAAAGHFGISYESMTKGLEAFKGTDRRFQWKGERNGIVVVDDYAHHPTEIRALLSAASAIKHREIWCIFQPHTYSRTEYLFDDFAKAFTQADHVIIADIFAAREANNHTITAEMLAKAIINEGKNAHYLGDFPTIINYLKRNCFGGDLLLTVGAGNVYEIGEGFLKD